MTDSGHSGENNDDDICEARKSTVFNIAGNVSSQM